MAPSAEPLTATPGLIVCTDVSFEYGRSKAAAGANGAGSELALLRDVNDEQAGVDAARTSV